MNIGSKLIIYILLKAFLVGGIVLASEKEIEEFSGKKLPLFPPFFSQILKSKKFLAPRNKNTSLMSPIISPDGSALGFICLQMSWQRAIQLLNNAMQQYVSTTMCFFVVGAFLAFFPSTFFPHSIHKMVEKTSVNFTFRTPLSCQDKWRELVYSINHMTETLKNTTILVIDDNEVNLEVISQMWKQAQI